VCVSFQLLTETEKRKRDAGTTEEKIAIDRLWNKRPDGFAIKKSTETKGGDLVILEFKRMSCVTNQYFKRAKHVAEAQYSPIKSALQRTLGFQGWTVKQKSFIDRTRTLDEGDLHDNLTYFKVPQERFNGRPKNKGDHDQMDTGPGGPSPPLITFLQA
jgi:hypothetical protein